MFYLFIIFAYVMITLGWICRHIRVFLFAAVVAALILLIGWLY